MDNSDRSIPADESVTYNAFGITFDPRVAMYGRKHIPWQTIREKMAEHSTEPASVEERIERDAG